MFLSHASIQFPWIINYITAYSVYLDYKLLDDWDQMFKQTVIGKAAAMALDAPQGFSIYCEAVGGSRREWGLKSWKEDQDQGRKMRFLPLGCWTSWRNTCKCREIAFITRGWCSGSSMGSGVRMPGFQFRLHYLLVEMPWMSGLTSLGLNFLICKMGWYCLLHRVTYKLNTEGSLSRLGPWGALTLLSCFTITVHNQEGAYVHATSSFKILSCKRLEVAMMKFDAHFPFTLLQTLLWWLTEM